ncbi:hypothetical protein SH501x_004843 [Pirellulaceae bacterium SH501]
MEFGNMGIEFKYSTKTLTHILENELEAVVAPLASPALKVNNAYLSHVISIFQLHQLLTQQTASPPSAINIT